MELSAFLYFIISYQYNLIFMDREDKKFKYCSCNLIVSFLLHRAALLIQFDLSPKVPVVLLYQ